MPAYSRSEKPGAIPNGRQKLLEDLMIYEIIQLTTIFDLKVSAIINPRKCSQGMWRFKCPWCKRIRTSSLVVLAMHLTAWHYDRIDDEARFRERKVWLDMLLGKGSRRIREQPQPSFRPIV